MKKILMNKYGFIRNALEDFSDDGNRFTCYKAGTRVRVSKHVSDGMVFISARIDGNKLPYEVYSGLAHYKALDRLNGVSLSSLNEDDLLQLYKDCLAYEQEYTDAENNIVMPTYEQIKAQCVLVEKKLQAEYNEIEQLLNQNLYKLVYVLTDREWLTIKNYLVEIDKQIKKFKSEQFISYILGSSTSINFCRPDCYELNHTSYYYNSLKETIGKVA